MFTVRQRNLSMSSLNRNPEISSNLSKRKQMFKNKQSSAKESESQFRSTKLLPKLNTARQSNSPNSNFIEIDIKKQQKTQVKDLSLSINKYYSNRAQFLKKPFHQFAYNIQSVIENFSKTDNNFQQLFQFISEDIKKFMFMTGNAELTTKYSIREGQVYRRAVQEMDRFSHKKMKQLNEKLRQATDQKQEIEQEFTRTKLYLQQQNKKLLEEIQWFKKVTNKQYTAYLEEKLKQQQERIQQLEQSQKQLIMLRDEYEKQIQKQADQLDEQRQQIARLTRIMNEMKSGKAQSQRVILKLRDRFDQINFKMIGMKDVIQTVQNQNQTLKTQNAILIKRAAVNFQELTPRPKYKKMISFTEEEQKLKLKPTIEIAQFLVKMLKKPIYQDSMRNQLFDQKLNSKKQYHPKLQQAIKFREATINSITESKQQLSNVRKLLAKNSYI